MGAHVRGQLHINGIESFWSMLKGGYAGVCHRMSPEHVSRYVGEFEGRHHVRNRSTVDQMIGMVCSVAGERPRYAALICSGRDGRALIC